MLKGFIRSNNIDRQAEGITNNLKQYFNLGNATRVRLTCLQVPTLRHVL